MQLRVLSISNSTFDEECLLPLHQLSYFRFESPEVINSRLTRILRYLSVKFALRSVILRRWPMWSYRVDKRTKALESCALGVLCTSVKPAFGYTDPLPLENDTPMDLPLPILHEFEIGETRSFEDFINVCLLPLRRLTFTLKYGVSNPFRVGSDTNISNDTTNNTNITPGRDASAASSSAASCSTVSTSISQFTIRPVLLGLQHLNLTFHLLDEYVHDLAVCTQLESLRLEYQGNRSFNLSWIASLIRLEDLTLDFSEGDRRITKIAPASYEWIRSLNRLKKLALHLKTGVQFPSHVIAQHLASLPGFARFDLSLLSESYFAITPSFLTAVVSARRWTSFHLVVPFHDKKLFQSFESPIHRLPLATMLSDSLTRFRVYRHPDHLQVGQRGGIPTQFRIQVNASSSSGGKPTAVWREC